MSSGRGILASGSRGRGIIATRMRPEAIRELIVAGLPGATVIVRGEDGTHFEAEVVSDAFTGKPTLARHRLVYAALGALMGGEIHALALKTLSPAEHAATQ